MNINDETLSAFLDQELPEQQMAEVRDAIAANPQLSERLAELANADALVKQHANAIDSLPMPEAITAMLQQAPESSTESLSTSAQPTNKVVQLSAWRRSRDWLSQHAALAAGVMLVIGFAAGNLTTSPPDSSSGEAVLAHLDTIPSGETVTVAPNTQILNRFTFMDQQGRPCRQYQLQSAETTTENVACRQQGQWQLEAMARTPDQAGDLQYRPATGAAALDSVLDGMMAKGALSLQEEAQLMEKNWERQ